MLRLCNVIFGYFGSLWPRERLVPYVTVNWLRCRNNENNNVTAGCFLSSSEPHLVWSAVHWPISTQFINNCSQSYFFMIRIYNTLSLSLSLSFRFCANWLFMTFRMTILKIPCSYKSQRRTLYPALIFNSCNFSANDSLSLLICKLYIIISDIDLVALIVMI